MTGSNRSLLKPHDMEAEGIPEAHVSGIDLDYRARALTSEQMSQLPEPVLDESPDWVELYWRTWAIAFDRVRSPDVSTGFLPFCDAAFSENVFQWDTCFLIGFVRFASHVLPVSNSLDNFYAKQHSDGFICREISSVTGKDFWSKDHPSSVNPPLFSDGEWRLFEVTGDRGRLQQAYPNLCRYHDWLRAHRRHADGVGYWTTALASGMDNSPRAFLSGGSDADKDYGHSWMCLTSQQALDASHLATIARMLSKDDESRRYRDEHQQLIRYIEERYWNDDLGFFVDRDQYGELTDVLTPAGLWPVLAGAGTPAMHARLFEVIADPKRFWRPHVLPSVSADHPTYHHAGNYWQGAVWPPMVALAVRAAQRTARDALALAIARNHLANLTAVFRDTGTLWENYSPEYPRRGNVSRPEFVGWSGCGPIEMLIEVIIGIRVSAETSSIRWVSQSEGRHGVNNLAVAGHSLSLVYEPRSKRLTYDASRAFNLQFERDGARHDIEIVAGSGELEIE